MGESASKAITLGVGILVTLMITSSIVLLFSQMGDIYSQVGSTNTNINTKFNEYTAYDNTNLTGLEMINCANKYYNDRFVVIELNGRQLNNVDGLVFLEESVTNGSIKYEEKYLAIKEIVEYDGIEKTRITFTKI